MSALATVTGKSFSWAAYLLQKNDFLDREFYVNMVDVDIGSLKSLHILFDKYLYHMLVKFEQNCMGRTMKNLKLFDKNGKPFLTKCWRHF